MIRFVILALALVFIGWDVFQGFRRGLYPALVRFGFICGCFVLAYFLSAPLSGLLTDVPLAFFNGQTLHEAYEGFLMSQEDLAQALALSDMFMELVLHLPEVLLSEIDFVILFVILRLITLPISYVICRKCFGKDGKQVGPASQTVRVVGGIGVGALQGIICLAVILVPIFGVAEFGERFNESFANSEEQTFVEISQGIDDAIVTPVNSSGVTKICGALGIRSLCVSAFHGLSSTEVQLTSGEKTIDYFEYLESMFPVLSTLVKLADVDPEHMTTEDYSNLADVLHTAKTNEELTSVVEDSVSNVVSQFVDESYRESANVVVSIFADKVVNGKETITGEKLAAEVEAIKDTMVVIKSATSEAADSAFEVVGADTLVDGIIRTEMLYDTLVEVANDPEMREVLCQDFTMNDSQKELMKTEIEKYRVDSAETRTPEDLAKILEITDALGLVLGVELEKLPE